MSARGEYLYSEILCDSKIMENFPNEKSAYYQGEGEEKAGVSNRPLIATLNWHIGHSLKGRQKQVIQYLKQNLSEREIAAVLGVSQQVVHIYKWRAIKKLRGLIGT